ncbi:unnamed protein product [Phaeothamnion confervicola]
MPACAELCVLQLVAALYHLLVGRRELWEECLHFALELFRTARWESGGGRRGAADADAAAGAPAVCSPVYTRLVTTLLYFQRVAAHRKALLSVPHPVVRCAVPQAEIAAATAGAGDGSSDGGGNGERSDGKRQDAGGCGGGGGGARSTGKAAVPAAATVATNDQHTGLHARPRRASAAAVAAAIAAAAAVEKDEDDSPSPPHVAGTPSASRRRPPLSNAPRSATAGGIGSPLSVMKCLNHVAERHAPVVLGRRLAAGRPGPPACTTVAPSSDASLDRPTGGGGGGTCGGGGTGSRGGESGDEGSYASFAIGYSSRDSSWRGGADECGGGGGGGGGGGFGGGFGGGALCGTVIAPGRMVPPRGYMENVFALVEWCYNRCLEKVAEGGVLLLVEALSARNVALFCQDYSAERVRRAASDWAVVMSLLRSCPGLMAMFPPSSLRAKALATSCAGALSRAAYEDFLSSWSLCQRNTGGALIPAVPYDEPFAPELLIDPRLNPVFVRVIEICLEWHEPATEAADVAVRAAAAMAVEHGEAAMETAAAAAAGAGGNGGGDSDG